MACFKFNSRMIFALFAVIAASACGEAVQQVSSPNLGTQPSDPSKLIFETPPAPQIVQSQFKPNQLAERCQSAIAEAKLRLDKISRLGSSDRSIDQTLISFENTIANLRDTTSSLGVMAYVGTMEGVRAEASACNSRTKQFLRDAFARTDLYERIHQAQPRNEDERRLLENVSRKFEDNGVSLAENQRAELAGLKQTLSALEARFQENIREDGSFLNLSDEELAGVSSVFLRTLKRGNNGLFYVPVRDAAYQEIMKNASNGETRRRVMYAYVGRAAQTNTPILEQALQIRQKIASLLGAKNWAEYRLRGTMAQDPETVRRFLKSLEAKLAERNQRDLSTLLVLKQQLDPSAARGPRDLRDVKLWDTAYLGAQLKKRYFSTARAAELDGDKLREYFSAEQVFSSILNLYSRQLGVHFSIVEDASAWIPGVKLYRVNDFRDGRLLAYFYADLYSRGAKQSRMVTLPLIRGRALPDGSYQKPVSALIAAFSAGQGGRPSLLGPEEVEALFGEIGNLMQQTLTRAPYASLSGSTGPKDLSELPSQMMKNWIESPELLVELSGHYLNPAEKIPADLAKGLIDAKGINRGIYYGKQLMLSLLDLEYHTTAGPVDTTAIQARLSSEVLGMDPIPGSHMQAGFSHLMSGYDAIYYSYLWDDVYAWDLLATYETRGIEFRRQILERGNTMPGSQLVQEFLGRDPSPDAFFQSLGSE